MKYWNEWVQTLHENIILLTKFLFASIISYLIDFKMLFLALGWAMFFDLITGILAYKKVNKIKISVYNSEYLIKSKLLRLSFEKMGAYLIIILCMAIFESHVFKIHFELISDFVGKPFYATAMITTICIMIEYWSILENLKKLGIDVVANIHKIINTILKIKNKISM